MSPSESDLRAALRAGEPDDGDAVNADHIIGAARSIRARRRNVALSVAAAVVVVAGVAGGVAALTGRGSSGGGSTTPAAQGAGSALGSSAASVGSAPGPSRAAPINGAMGTAVTCAPTPPQIALPGGGSPGQFGASGPLISRQVTSFGVCVYTISLQSGTNPVKHEKPQSVMVTGAAAQQLAASLTNAATTPQSVACPLIRSTRQVTIVMTPITADGTRLTPITAATSIPACNTQVTNGTAVRYNWHIPTRLQQALGVTVAGGRDVQNPVDLVPGQVVSSIARVSGSPVK